MTSNTGAIERKAVDVSGRLGSLYNASIDKLTNQHSVEASKVQKFNRYSVCELLSDNQSSDRMTYLEAMDFDDALQQSILFSMITTSGVSSLIDYDQSINENTRFLYYSYKSKEEELTFIPGKADQIVPTPTIPTRTTHMITKILWGFEFLCVISVPDYVASDTIDQLLRNISSRLKDGGSDFLLTENEKQHLDQLNNVTVYGSETCIENSNTSLLTVLTSLNSWQTQDNFHHPLKYSMYSLRYLYNNDQFPDIYHVTDQPNNDIEKISTTMIPIDNSIKDIARFFEKIPHEFSNPTLNQQWTYYKEEFCALLDVFKTFRNTLRAALVNVRQNFSESMEIHQIILDQHCSSIKTKLEILYQDLYQWYRETGLTERCNHDHIQYINIFDIFPHQHTPITITNIGTALQRSLAKEDIIVILWYSSDQLKRIKNHKWEQIYERLVFEKRRTIKQTSIVYVDFSQCQQILDDFIVIKLPVQSKSDHQYDPLRGKDHHE